MARVLTPMGQFSRYAGSVEDLAGAGADATATVAPDSVPASDDPTVPQEEFDAGCEAGRGRGRYALVHPHRAKRTNRASASSSRPSTRDQGSATLMTNR